MKTSFEKLKRGYRQFRHEYASGKQSLMEQLAQEGQKPEIMIVACSDSRVDPSLILGCHPGDLFVVRNVANIVPPYERDEKHHGTSAALEFAVYYLQIKHLIILGHSHCGGIHALLQKKQLAQNDFITHWVSLLDNENNASTNPDTVAKNTLAISYQNCLTFPWIKSRVTAGTLEIHRWFFDIQSSEIQVYSSTSKNYEPF